MGTARPRVISRHDHPPPAIDHDVLTDLDGPVASEQAPLPGGYVLDQHDGYSVAVSTEAAKPAPVAVDSPI